MSSDSSYPAQRTSSSSEEAASSVAISEVSNGEVSSDGFAWYWSDDSAYQADLMAEAIAAAEPEEEDDEDEEMVPEEEQQDQQEVAPEEEDDDEDEMVAPEEEQQDQEEVPEEEEEDEEEVAEEEEYEEEDDDQDVAADNDEADVGNSDDHASDLYTEGHSTETEETTLVDALVLEPEPVAPSPGFLAILNDAAAANEALVDPLLDAFLNDAVAAAGDAAGVEEDGSDGNNTQAAGRNYVLGGSLHKRRRLF